MMTTTGDHGAVEQQDDRRALRFRRRLDHPVERVWAALTRPEELHRWWGDAEVDLVEGGTFTLRWRNVDLDGNRVELPATITALTPTRVLELAGAPHGVLRWKLRPDGDGTVLGLTATNAVADEHLPRMLAGWHYHLHALAEVLGGGALDLVDLPNEHWHRLHDAYAARQAATGRRAPGPAAAER
jgi:uncharacterized protein YndB with AHSA1/START domain